MSEEDNTPELVLDDVVAVEPDDLTDEHRTFLEENKADLTDEQAEKFGIEREEEEEEEEPRIRIAPTPTKKIEEEEEIDPDDQKRINKIVDQRMKEAGVGDTRNQLEVDAAIRNDSELASYRDRALKYMKVHPTLVAQDALAIVSGKDREKIGAKKEREAIKRANESVGSGTSARKTTPSAGKDWSKASPEEMAAKRDEVLGRN